MWALLLLLLSLPVLAERSRQMVGADILRRLHASRAARAERDQRQEQKQSLFQPSLREEMIRGNGHLEDLLHRQQQLHGFYKASTLESSLGYRAESLPQNAYFQRGAARRKSKKGKNEGLSLP